MTFSKILVPYDGSTYSDKAFDKALEIASKFSSEITALSILEAETEDGHIGKSLDKLEEKQDQRVSEAKSMLENLQEEAQAKNVPIVLKTIHDPSPSEGILTFAQSNEVGLIVMGSHGRTGLKKLVLGSIANDVVVKAKCPVLIIKQSE
ncbi:universal stress protein [Nitrosopumilus sp.]|uniref:universal stress protein n=1 Tax=Nitrosopumilus sp. TaxID=2024843 RepID=UPI003B5AEFBD